MLKNKEINIESNKSIQKLYKNFINIDLIQNIEI